MRKIILLIILPAMILVSSLASAQRMSPFEKMDRNNDGSISRQEFKGPSRAFNIKDSNGDGYLNSQEMRGRKINNSPPARAVVSASKLLYVDTHNHIVGKRMQSKGGASDSSAATRAALDTMDANGVKLNLIMPMPQAVTQKNRLSIDDILPVVQQYPDRFALLGGGGSLNVMIQEALSAGRVTQADEDAFDRKAADLIADGIVGFGEMTAEHFSMRSDHPYTTAPPDHPLFLRLADLAAKYNVPIDLHMEAIPYDMPPSGTP